MKSEKDSIQTINFSIFKLVEIFAAKNENVQIFFTDFFGINEVYNRPGTSGDPNWTLRLPDHFEDFYERHLECGDALNLPC